MSSIQRRSAAGVLGPIARTSLILAISIATGCSADVTRFGYGGSTTSSIPVPAEPVNRGGGYQPRGLGVTEAPLPPPEVDGNYRVVGRHYDNAPPRAPASYPPAAHPQSYDRPPAYEPAPPYGGRPAYEPAPGYGRPPAYEPPGPQTLGPPPSPPPSHARMPAAPQRPGGSAETVEVQAGDTLFSIARRHGVTVAAIRDANGLTGDAVRPGQRLVVPSGLQHAPGERTTIARAPDPEPPQAPKLSAPDRTAPARPTALRPLPPGAEPPPGWEGRYTMRNGDSLYGIAFQHRVSLEELMRANNITDPTKVWAGTVLAVPERPQPAAEETSKGPPRIVQVQPRIINADPGEPSRGRTAMRTDVANDASPPAAAAGGKFRWPVRGKIISGFGKQPDGRHNDGINIAVPLGTDIVAAESGRVAYADNELKGYGNLILIRHPNGWVSAYAHADQLLVKAKDEVRRGQVIAKAGKTGAVEQPQLHFELRQASGPVDPIPHLSH